MKYIHTIQFLIAILISCSILSCSGNTDEPVTIVNGVPIPQLLPRKDSTLGGAGEGASIKEVYNKAIESIKANKDDPKAYINLASAYILEGRLTGNGTYYSNAAMKMLQKVLDGEESSKEQRFEALSLKSAVLLNMHQFKDALDVANQGVVLDNYNAGIYGALVDANVELGHYTDAVQDCDKMLSIRPDLRSYSRASYLRQIYGDNNGAKEAMKMAVASGVPGLEQTEWARVNLADLYLNTGNLDSASLLYRTSLVYRPGYPYGEMGLAKVERARKNYDAAIAHARTAIKAMSEAPFVTFLGDLYALQGNAAKAKEVRGDVTKLLEEGKASEPKHPAVLHNGNRELAIAWLNAGDLDKALSYAKTDYNMRPDNIDANDLMAWISYEKKDLASAKNYAMKTLVTNTKNATTLYKDGIIFSAAGNAPLGDSLKRVSLSVNPYIDPLIANAPQP